MPESKGEYRESATVSLDLNGEYDDVVAKLESTGNDWEQVRTVMADLERLLETVDAIDGGMKSVVVENLPGDLAWPTTVIRWSMPCGCSSATSWSPSTATLGKRPSPFNVVSEVYVYYTKRFPGKIPCGKCRVTTALSRHTDKYNYLSLYLSGRLAPVMQSSRLPGV